MSYNQDGLLDIVIGLYALAFGIGIVADKILELGFASIIPAIMIVIVLPIWIQAKRTITMPRIGFVKFGARGSKERVRRQDAAHGAEADAEGAGSLQRVQKKR
jgi:hypothetical protein